MRYTTIPGTDLRTSTICMGTGPIGSAVDRPASFALLDAYVDQGGTFLDSASVYANWIPTIERSISEKTIGLWLKARGNRDRIVVGTKGGHPELSTMHISRLSRADIIHDVNASLANLQTDVIDLYWLHRDEPQRPVGEIVETLNEQVRLGKVRYLGCSNWQPVRVQAAQEYAAQHGLQGFVASQTMWSLAAPDPAALGDKTMVAMDDEFHRYHAQTGLAAIPYSSQANGYFQKLAQGGAAAIKPAQARVYGTAENQERFRRIQKLCADTELTVSQVVLGYMQSQPFTTIPIVGCRTLDQLADSLAAGDVRLTSEQVRYLESGH
jgi:aryl-alcohol dehydrogenase-like predicted oxidoreductase